MHTLNLKYFVFLLVIAFSIACGNSKDRTEKVNLSEVEEIDLQIKRYEQDLFAMDPNNISEQIQDLATKYPLFLQGNITDSANIMQIHDFISDPTILKLQSDCQKAYPDLVKLEEDLSQAFRYYKYYFPEDKIPSVITYVSGGDVENPIKFTDYHVIIALDMYLGANYPIYAMWGVPGFARYTMDSPYIVADVMYKIAQSKVASETSDKTLLEMMVYYGKLYYFTEAMMPETADSIIIGYNAAQTDWIEVNEGNVWGFFVDKELLYSSDNKNNNRFLNDGPFTSAFSKKSPPKIGQWMGWQIIKKYMNENEKISLADLLKQDDAQAILNKSKYKPEKTE